MLEPEHHAQAIRKFLAQRQLAETRLRLAGPEDAQFILNLRLDPSRNRHLSATKADLETQQSWLHAYLEREKQGKEAYFILEHAGEAVGTIRIYDYRLEAESFCWGSWIIKPNSPPSVAYRSVILIYDLAFGPLAFSRSHFDVRRENKTVWTFHERMGAALTEEMELDRFYDYPRETYLDKRARFERFAQGFPFANQL